MKIKNLLTILVALALSACGGGGSSSGASEPAPTKYAGNYRGVYNVTESGETFRGPLNVSVSANGRVDLGTGPTGFFACGSGMVSNRYLNSNKFNSNGHGSCFVDGLGSCELDYAINLTFTIPSVTGSMKVKASCSEANLDLVYHIGANRV
jgi:hypothetical protein